MQTSQGSRELFSPIAIPPVSTEGKLISLVYGERIFFFFLSSFFFFVFGNDIFFGRVFHFAFGNSWCVRVYVCMSVIPIRLSRASRSTPGGSFDDLHSFGVWREIELLLL